MQLTLAQWPSHLAQSAQKGLRPLYVLMGDEPLLMQEAGDALRQAALTQGYSEKTITTVTGAHTDWSSVLAAGNAMSLFADKQWVELRIPSGKPGKEGSVALQQLAEKAAEHNDVLTVVKLPKLDKTSQKAAWFVALDSHGVVLRVDPVARTQLPAWLAQRLTQAGLHLPGGEEAAQILQFMAEQVEGNLLAAHQEIEKLALLYPAQTLSLSQVREAVLQVSRYDVFGLGDAVFGGQAARAQKMLDGLQAEGETPVLVHWALADEVRALYRCHQALAEGKPMPMVLKEQRIWGDKERRFERLLPRLKSAALSRALQDAHVVDGVIKGLKHPDWPHEPWDALHRWMMRLLQMSKPPQR